jgi:hypothetical protein
MNPILFLLSTAFFTQNHWQLYTSPDGRFQIEVPGSFTEKTDSVKTDVGDLVYHTFFLQTDSTAENLFYMVSYCDYPASVVFADSTGLAEDFFKETIEAATETVKGELTYSADIQLDTHPGKTWRIDYLGGKAVIKNRAYLVGNRYYALQTIAWKDKSLNADGTKFFDSFKLAP